VGKEIADRSPALLMHDPTKIVLTLVGTGADGQAVSTVLEERGVTLEFADRDTFCPVITLADTDETVNRMVDEIIRAIEEHRGTPRLIVPLTAWTVDPDTAMSPRDAFFADHERVSAAEAVGRIAAETAAPYPPGIPALAPGERIHGTVLAALQAALIFTQENARDSTGYAPVDVTDRSTDSGVPRLAERNRHDSGRTHPRQELIKRVRITPQGSPLDSEGVSFLVVGQIAARHESLVHQRRSARVRVQRPAPKALNVVRTLFVNPKYETYFTSHELREGGRSCTALGQNTLYGSPRSASKRPLKTRPRKFV